MWPSYVINLAENTIRMQNSSDQLSAQNILFQRIDAVNGWEMTQSQIAEVYDPIANRRRAKHPLVPAEIGCYLSHIKAWETIANSDAAGGFIFEDDILTDDTLAPVLTALSQDGGWEMVKLFTLTPDAPMMQERTLAKGFRIGIPKRVPNCLLGYGLTKKAAAKLAKNPLPIVRPVDEDLKFFWETGLRSALVSPQPLRVGAQDAVTGSIGRSRREDSPLAPPRNPLAQALHGLRYQLEYRLALAYHHNKGKNL